MPEGGHTDLHVNLKVMKRATIYARVSTKSNGKNPETQLVALRDRFRTEDGN